MFTTQTLEAMEILLTRSLVAAVKKGDAVLADVGKLREEVARLDMRVRAMERQPQWKRGGNDVRVG
jgi:hypothetical protein